MMDAGISRLSRALEISTSRPQDSFLRSEWMDHAERAFTGLMVASGGVPSEGYGHGTTYVNTPALGLYYMDMDYALRTTYYGPWTKNYGL